MYIQPINIHTNNFKQKQNTPVNKNASFLQDNKKTVIISTVGVALAGVLSYFLTKQIKNLKHQKIVKAIKDKIDAQFNLVDKTKGLNKIKNNEQLIENIREWTIKPYIMERIGMDMASTNSLPNGMVLNANTQQKGKEVVQAFMEHMHELGYKTVNIDNSLAKCPDDFSKKIGYTVKAIQEKFPETKEYTFINIGCLDDYAHSRRYEPSYLDAVGNLLKPFENSSQRGVFWAGWTKDIEKLDDALVDRGCIFNAL